MPASGREKITGDVMTKLNEKPKINLFILLCCAVYFMSYLTRKNYDACLVEIYTSMNITKTLAGLASTGAVITYGAGQLLSGVLGDKLKPQNIIISGLALTSVCNVLMPLSGNIYAMIVIWCINGLAQAMMWPPLVKIMSEKLSNADYKKAVLYVTIASSSATIITYLLIPICIKVSIWKTAFFISGGGALAILFVWKFGIDYFNKVTGNVNNESVKEEAVSKVSFNTGFVFASGLIPIAIAIILQGTLRDGVTTWMPSIVSELYNLENSLSILTTIALPILAIFSATIASAIQRKMKNEVASALLLFGVSLLSTVLLILFCRRSVIVSIVLFAVITACMHGINLMLVCEVPNYFAKYNLVSTISGVLNSFTYVGAAISIYAIAAITEKTGNWEINFKIWAVISLLGLVFCAVTLKKWKSFRNAEGNI